MRKLLHTWDRWRAIPIEDDQLKMPETARYVCQKDDFGQFWCSLNQSLELPTKCNDEGFLQLILQFRNASKRDHRVLLRDLQRFLPETQLRQLSQRWWSLLTTRQWVQPSRQLPQPSFSGYSVINRHNCKLAHGLMALHLHLHGREAVKDLQFFIVRCEDTLPNLGKVAPYLSQAGRQLQRRYSMLPSYNDSKPSKQPDLSKLFSQLKL